jgi:superfamily II DNA/RNA helicase
MSHDNFKDFDLHETLQRSIDHIGFEKPTPIQQQAIPLALQGHDILGTAQTGTGKTAAFAIPLVEALLLDKNATALILTPTRELGQQVIQNVRQLLGAKTKIQTAFIIGGQPITKQFAQLRSNPRVIVGTPGRINDHLERQTLDLSKTNFLVLDETDRMLDMGFSVQLERIFKHLPEQRQTLMFSATMPKNIKKMAAQYLKNPQRISIGKTNEVAQNIEQETLNVEQSQKYDTLKEQLLQRTGSVIVFVKTKYNADRMATNLRRDGFTSEALHGDLKQNKRDRVMQNLRKSNFRILVATDIAARGIDVPHIEHVINYDLPQMAEDFIHRMGRTARAGASGKAMSFITSQDRQKWRAIEMVLDPEKRKSEQNDEHSGSGKKKKPSQKRWFKKGSQNQNKSDARTNKKKPDRPRSEGQKSNNQRPNNQRPNNQRSNTQRPNTQRKDKRRAKA